MYIDSCATHVPAFHCGTPFERLYAVQVCLPAFTPPYMSDSSNPMPSRKLSSAIFCSRIACMHKYDLLLHVECKLFVHNELLC